MNLPKLFAKGQSATWGHFLSTAGLNLEFTF